VPIVKLANEKKFGTEPGQILLESGRAHGCMLEHSCCSGRCGVCKARVLSGQTAIEIAEEALSQDEVDAGFILTCCRSALSDVELDQEDLGVFANLEPKTLPCRIDSLVALAADVLEVTLRTPPSSPLCFVPGQHVDIIGHEGVRRSYSIACRPRDDGKLKLHIRKVMSGVMSDYWFGMARANDLLRLEGPLGTFSLRTASSEALVFLATGTGIAPVKAMLDQMDADPGYEDWRKVVVYWGGRVPEDIYWEPAFSSLSVEFIPVLSRAKAAWSGRAGYVQNALLEDFPDLAEVTVYACGSNDMIQSARRELLQAGLPDGRFYSDAFVSSN
jgi:CDP-4-dehydro-6-deoxyglucose reductase